MPEHTHDPIRELENFDSGGLGMTPLEPAQVRRLGDRRRTRRNALLVAAATVAVVAAASPVVLLDKGDGSEASAPAVTTTSSPSSSPSPTAPTTEPPKEITYPGNGVEVKTPADLDKLTGTSTEFRSFIADQLGRIGGPASCAEITVQKYSSAGRAIGAVSSCGGYVALWVERSGVWQEGMGTQDVWDCDTLGYLDVPTSFAGECTDESGDFGPGAVGDLRLGMTRPQIEAAGGSLDSGGTSGCLGLLLPHESPVANQVDGWYSPDQGLVSIEARPGMKTPERIGLGSSQAAVLAAYPSISKKLDLWVLPLGHGDEYEIGIGEDGTVQELALAKSTQNCFG